MKKKGRIRSGKRVRRNRKLVILSSIVAASAFIFVVAMTLYVIFGMNPESNVPEGELADEAIFETSFEEPEPVSEYLNESIVNSITDAGYSVTEALQGRPETVEMTDENRSSFVNIDNCLIMDTKKVQIDCSSEGIPSSDDKYYYLFEEATFEDSIPEDAEPLDKIYKNESTSFTVNLNKGEADSRLFSKFTVAVKLDGEYVSISKPKYITNPGACAGYSYGGMKHHSIKGLLPDPLRIGELADQEWLNMPGEPS